MAALQVILWLVVVLYVPVVASWWYFAAYYLRRLRRDPLRLETVPEWPAGTPAPSLAVIVACHNEAAGIEDFLARLRQQTYPNLRILVADDRSTDATGALLRAAAARDPRIERVEIAALPPGWLGKTHAVARAVERSTAEYLLFLDSDVELAPHALNTVMQKVCRDGIDFLSFWPRLELRSFWEQVLTPPALLLLSVWALPRSPAGDVAGQTPLGNGQFLLVRRQAYEALGGHAGVPDELAEDAVLAARAHAAGQRCWAGLGEGIYTAYRVGGFRRTANALARVLVGSLRQQRRLWLGTQILLAGGFAPAWVLPVAALGLALGWPAGPLAALLALGALHWAGLTLTLRRALAMTLVRRGSLAWFPFGALLVTGILVWSSYLLSGRGTLRWGPTRYRLRGSRVVAAAGGAPPGPRGAPC